MAHPRMYDDSNAAIKRLREICLALPGVFEKEAWGEWTFRVTGGRMVAVTDTKSHHRRHGAILKDGYLIAAPNKRRAGTRGDVAAAGAALKRISRPLRQKKAPGRVR